MNTGECSKRSFELAWWQVDQRPVVGVPHLAVDVVLQLGHAAVLVGLQHHLVRYLQRKEEPH